MVAESSRNPIENSSKDLTASELEGLQSWTRQLQQALSLEADKGFQNLQGRAEKFHCFISRKILEPPLRALPSDIQLKLKELSVAFNDYPLRSVAVRRRLVANSRQILHSIRRSFEPEEKIKPPKLRIHGSEFETTSDLNLECSDLSLNSPLIRLKGVGTKVAERFAGIGLFLISDLLQHYPRDYVDYSSLKRIQDLEIGEAATIVASVRRCTGFISPKNQRLLILELHLQDVTGRIKVTRFFAGHRFSNPAFLKSQVRLYPPGATIAVSGLVKGGPYGKSFHDPLLEVMDNPMSPLRSKVIGKLLPVYSLTEGLTADRFREVVKAAIPLASKWIDPLSQSRLKELSLIRKCEAILNIHLPQTQEDLRAAKRRLVFDEFLLLQLGLLRRRRELRSCSAPPLNISIERDGLVGRFLALLPFPLTQAQIRVLGDIESDLIKSEPMARLLQGDVGSGKTVVALTALLKAVEAGCQGALMAPTEVLAEQHYRTFCRWLPQLHVSVELLTGSTTNARRHQILSDLSNGTLKILLGTHALIEDQVSFSRLGLVVVDEQHRFGVHQRNRLLSKGLQPHLLTMTATPIPRTLALSVHGDLDVSQIDELPPGRTPIKTSLLSSSDRDLAYQLIRDQVEHGLRAYVVLPLVEESEKLDLRSAVAVYEQLSNDVFKDLNVGLLHGRMSSAEKQRVIGDFGSGRCQILVSTTVIEVGVDVPEATVMVIDHADRFGLAQLHQLRGRVGRGAKASHCVLINDSKNVLAKQRLEVLVRSNDGFEISEIDMRLRGPGQILGTRQSGLPDFALANLAEDADVLEEARQEAIFLLNVDPHLEAHSHLKSLLDEHWERLGGKANLN